MVRYTADGKRLLGWSDAWYARDVPTGARTTLKPRATLTEEFNGLGTSTVTNNFKSLSADGATILTLDPVRVAGAEVQFGDPVAGYDLRLHDTGTGKVVTSRTLKGWISAGVVGSSPGGRSVILDGYWAADKDRRLVVTSVDEKVADIVLEQEGRQWGNNPFVYSGDGHRIATVRLPAGVDGRPMGRGRVHVWDATTGKLLRELTPDPFGDGNNHTRTGMSHDGQWLAAFATAHQTSSDRPEPTWVEVWNLDTGVKSKTIPFDTGNRLFAVSAG